MVRPPVPPIPPAPLAPQPSRPTARHRPATIPRKFTAVCLGPGQVYQLEARAVDWGHFLPLGRFGQGGGAAAAAGGAWGPPLRARGVLDAGRGCRLRCPPVAAHLHWAARPRDHRVEFFLCASERCQRRAPGWPLAGPAARGGGRGAALVAGRAAMAGRAPRGG